MPYEIENTQKSLNDALNVSLNNAASIITKDYLDRLESFEVMEPSEEDTDIDISVCGHFYKLSKLVVNKEENYLNKLTTIFNVASSINCSIASIIKSNGQKIDYIFGIISKDARTLTDEDIKKREADATAIKGAMIGNLIGSDLVELSSDDVKIFKDNTFGDGDEKCYSSVSGIVALRDYEDKSIEGYVQGLENLVDSLKGQKYTIVMLADPISSTEIQGVKQGYELLHTQLLTLAKSSMTINESDTLTLSKANTEGFSEGISKGIALTQSNTKTKGNYWGGNLSVGANFIATVNLGINAGINRSISDTTGNTNTTMKMNQRNKSVTDTTGTAKSTGKSLQLNYENRSVKSLLDKIDKHLERLDKCESYGAFNCAAYVIADNRQSVSTVASNYNALMRGCNSYVQASHINIWHKKEPKTERIGKYISSFVHPRLFDKDKPEIIVTPASIISGNELAIQIGLPKKSVSGITVIPMAPFGRNVLDEKDDVIPLGKLYHMGHIEGVVGKEQSVGINIDSLTMHTFITGSTGKGKSTAIYSILDNLKTHKIKNGNDNIKFMVIEPAKGEYKDRFGYYDDVHVYGTNSKITPLLRINPFSFPYDNIHVLEHVDRMIEIFNVCWPMYAAMPAVLKDAIERAYVVSGWNLETSECCYKDSTGEPLYPSFIDVLNQINRVMEDSSYSSDSKGDYKGALCTRLRSLTNGIFGQVLTNNELSSKDLFDENVIIDLSRLGATDTKALIMGLLIMKLQEYRLSHASSGNKSLIHITVLEEAHHLLKRTSVDQSNESANIFGKSVEMLANSIAEMRTFGEGFIIADQSPGLMDKSVIRNTNTKIILGLPDLEDRELVGRSANLNDDQINELARLETFVAAVYQNNWLEPVLCNIEPAFKKVEKYKIQEKITAKEIDSKYKYIEYLLLPIYKRDELDTKYVTNLIDNVFKLSIPSEVKVAFIRYTNAETKDEIQKLRCQLVYSLFNSNFALGLAKEKETNIDLWINYIKEILQPDITILNERDQEKIIALITKEQAERDGSSDTIGLFERFIDHI